MSECISPNATLLDFAAIVDAVHGKAVFGCTAQKSGTVASRFCFLSVQSDSRKVEKNALFVPLKGEKVDAHTFIPEALKRGASCVFIESAVYAQNKSVYDALGENFPDAVFIVVENTLYALQDAARAYVKQFKNVKKIAVTGSSGKTTTKEILAAIFREALGSESVICNEGNLNSDIGLALSVFRLRAEHQVGIFEMGMNRKGEIAELASILVPDYAVITNVGTAHIGILGSRYAIAAEKKNVFSQFTASCKGFIPDDTEYSAFLRENVLGDIATFGDAALCGISGIKDCGIHGFEFFLAGEKVYFPLCGAHNFKNMLGAISVAQSFGISAEKIAHALPQVQSGFGRTQIVECGGISLIQDCYNANPDSMAAALDLTANITSRKIFILGDMKELGSESAKAHIQIAQHALKSGASVIVFFGENFYQALNEINQNQALNEINQNNTKILVFSTYTDSGIEEAALKINAALQTGDTVLLKASRSVALERIVPLLRASKSPLSKSSEVRYA